MKTLAHLIAVLALSFFALDASAQSNPPDVQHRYRVSLPAITLPQLVTKSWDARTHTQHVELHAKRNLDNKNIIGLKFATWRLFQPMGIVWWDGLLETIETGSEFYPGHVRHTGLGITYQRMLWRGLFATAELLPMYKTYLDEDGNSVANGFKLYSSYHLGYHLAFGKNKRFFVEPQVHSQHWPVDTNTPSEFSALEDKWRGYFLFEPNLYLGVSF